MNTFTKLKIDRIEEGIAIAFSNEGEEYHFSQKFANVRENDICDAIINDEGKVISLSVNSQETKRIRDRMHAKLNKLFNK